MVTYSNPCIPALQSLPASLVLLPLPARAHAAVVCALATLCARAVRSLLLSNGARASRKLCSVYLHRPFSTTTPGSSRASHDPGHKPRPPLTPPPPPGLSSLRDVHFKAVDHERGIDKVGRVHDGVAARSAKPRAAVRRASPVAAHLSSGGAAARRSISVGEVCEAGGRAVGAAGGGEAVELTVMSKIIF